MSDYNCPYCGREVAAEDVLFVDTSFDEFYEDVLRYEFLTGCSSTYPLENINRFRGLYHHATEENIHNRDRNGFPNVLNIKASKGLTPRELLESAKLEEGGTPAPTGESKPQETTQEKRLATRACPHCHCGLPTNFGIAPTINVTLLGGRAAGKTVFLIAMLQQLQSQLTQNGLGTVQLLPESQSYMQPQMDYYVQNNGISMPTPTERLFPLVFEYHYGNKTCFVAIYDIAGEGIVRERGVANIDFLVNHIGVEQAKVVWLIIDPNQLNDGGYTSKVENVSVDKGHEKFTMDIQRFLDNAVVSTGHFGILKNVEHVVAILTKLDLPLTNEPERFVGKVLITEDIGETHKNRVSLTALDTVDRNISQFLDFKLQRRSVKTLIETAFQAGRTNPPRVRLLGVSAYTRKLNAQRLEFSNVIHAQASKHRIIEPFLDLLAAYHVVPVGRDLAKPSTEGRDQRSGQRSRRSRWFGRD